MTQKKQTTKQSKPSSCPNCLRRGYKIPLTVAVKDKKKLYYEQPVMFCSVCSWFQWL
jgi:hypothetical protein